MNDDKPKGCGNHNERYRFIETKGASRAGVLQEYYLITGEIRWWRNLEVEALAKMLDKLDVGSDQIADNYFYQPTRLNGIITVI